MAGATDVDWHGVMPLAATHLIADWLSQPWFYVVVILWHWPPPRGVRADPRPGRRSLSIRFTPAGRAGL